MIAYFILGLALLIGTLMLGRWYVNADPKTAARAVKWTLAGVGTVGGLYLLFAGRHGLAAVLLPLVLPLLLRGRWLAERLKAARGPSPGQTSDVTTRFLRMTLDHDTGVMSGTVLDGQYRGRQLDELTLPELIELWRECRTEDEQSALVVEAYLDRAHGELWREAVAGESASAGGPGRGGGDMAREEALEILGLSPRATEDEVHEAHRRLMQLVHPDRGGSNYLAAKINRAKDVLLRR